MLFYEDILKEFQKNKVKYVLVGGMAVNLLGALRTTADMDILVDMTDQNLAKIVRVFLKKGYRVKQPVDPMDLANKKIRTDWIKNKNMKAFNFYKAGTYQEVDIIIDSPVSFIQARKSAKIIKVDNLKLPIVSMSNLMKMKRASGRPVDLMDIKDLKKIQAYEKK